MCLRPRWVATPVLRIIGDEPCLNIDHTRQVVIRLSDPLLGERRRPRLHDPDYSGLGGRIVGLPGVAGDPADRGDTHDPPVVPDRATQENRDHLRDEVERLETLHQLRNGSPHRPGALERVIDKVTANVRSFFICTRGDLLSGSIGRILGLRPSQALFVDRVVLANIVVSG